MSHSYADGLATAAAGAPLEELLTELDRVHGKIRVYQQTYGAALDHARNQPAPLLEPPLTVPEVCEALGIGGSLARKLISEGKLRRVEGLGNVVRVSRTELNRFLHNQPNN